MRTLHLNVHAKWFDMILALIKKEEYRGITEFWIRRLLGADYGVFPFTNEGFRQTYILGKNKPSVPHFDTITFRNGYKPLSEVREMIVEFKGIEIKEPVPEWSDNAQGYRFAILLGEIISKRNC